MDGATKGARAALRAEWRGILEQQAASGLAAARFCRERGIPAWKFSYWRAALRPRPSPPSRAGGTGGFVELSVSARPGGGTGVWIEAGRWRLHVEPGFDAAALRRAAEALSAP